LNRGAKVYEEAVIDTGGGEVVDELHFMFRGECEDCLEFDDKLVFDPQIRKVETNLMAFVKHWELNVLPRIDAALF